MYVCIIIMYIYIYIYINTHIIRTLYIYIYIYTHLSLSLYIYIYIYIYRTPADEDAVPASAFTIDCSPYGPRANPCPELAARMKDTYAERSTGSC